MFEDFSEWEDDEDEEEDILSSVFEIIDDKFGDGSLYIKVYKNELISYFEKYGIKIENIEINNTSRLDDKYELFAHIYPIGEKITKEIVSDIEKDFNRLYFIESIKVGGIHTHLMGISFIMDDMVELY